MDTYLKEIYRKLKVAIYQRTQYQKEISFGTYTWEHPYISKQNSVIN